MSEAQELLAAIRRYGNAATGDGSIPGSSDARDLMAAVKRNNAILAQGLADLNDQLGALYRRRRLPYDVKAGSRLTRASVNAAGTFSGYGSVFGVTDAYGDVVAKGAFAKTLREWRAKGQLPALLWQHDPFEPIGVYQEMYEDEHGLYVVGRLSETRRGVEARTLLRDGALSGLSIGFRTRRSTVDELRGTRILTEVELFEVSVVTFPANEAARVESAKAAEERQLVAGVTALSAEVRAASALNRYETNLYRVLSTIQAQGTP